MKKQKKKRAQARRKKTKEEERKYKPGSTETGTEGETRENKFRAQGRKKGWRTE